MSVNFTATSTFDAEAVAARIKADTAKAQKVLDAQVLADSNFFVPLQTSALQKSAINHTRIGSGAVIWRTPYAKAQYYGENFNHSQQRNPNACAKWFEAAKARFLENWKRLVENAIKHS